MLQQYITRKMSELPSEKKLREKISNLKSIVRIQKKRGLVPETSPVFPVQAPVPVEMTKEQREALNEKMQQLQSITVNQAITTSAVEQTDQSQEALNKRVAELKDYSSIANVTTPGPLSLYKYSKTSEDFKNDQKMFDSYYDLLRKLKISVSDLNAVRSVLNSSPDGIPPTAVQLKKIKNVSKKLQDIYDRLEVARLPGNQRDEFYNLRDEVIPALQIFLDGLPDLYRGSVPDRNDREDYGEVFYDDQNRDMLRSIDRSLETLLERKNPSSDILPALAGTTAGKPTGDGVRERNPLAPPTAEDLMKIPALLDPVTPRKEEDDEDDDELFDSPIIPPPPPQQQRRSTRQTKPPSPFKPANFKDVKLKGKDKQKPLSPAKPKEGLQKVQGVVDELKDVLKSRKSGQKAREALSKKGRELFRSVGMKYEDDDDDDDLEGKKTEKKIETDIEKRRKELERRTKNQVARELGNFEDDDPDADVDDKLKRGNGFTKVSKDGEFGALRFDMDKFFKMQLHAKKYGKVVAKGPLSHDLFLLLTQRFKPKHDYSEESLEAFKKLVDLAELPKLKAQCGKGKVLKGLIQPKKKTLASPASKSKTKFVYYDKPEELLERLQILMGSIDSGNNSSELREEASQLLDVLKSKEVISKIQYESLLESLM
jgi:hypothetical protein